MNYELIFVVSVSVYTLILYTQTCIYTIISCRLIAMLYSVHIVPYGMKYWRELYLADSLFLLFFPRSADFNLTDRSHVGAYASLAEFMAVLWYFRQFAKLNSLPIFHAIRYFFEH